MWILLFFGVREKCILADSCFDEWAMYMSCCAGLSLSRHLIQLLFRDVTCMDLDTEFGI